MAKFLDRARGREAGFCSQQRRKRLHQEEALNHSARGDSESLNTAGVTKKKHMALVELTYLPLRLLGRYSLRYAHTRCYNKCNSL